MNLSYSILWFDDDERYLPSMDLDDLKQKISDWGFSPTILEVNSREQFEQHAPYESIDLVVVDFNLAESGHGDEFIKQLRDHGVFSEVVFYSANPISDLWARILEHQLEGVYVANRTTVMSKIESVAKQSVRKVLDLDNVRGIVMAEVGDLDGLLESILRTGLESLDELSRVKIFEKFHDDAIKHPHKVLELLNRFKANPTIDLMLGLCDGSMKKWDNFNRVKKAHPDLKGMQVGQFGEEILDPRNSLAHGVPSRDGAAYKFLHRGKEYRFDDQESLRLRKGILSYKTLFFGIVEGLKK